MIGVGAQDDFNLALSFVTDFAVATPTMLWNRPLTIWSQYGVTTNSSMILANGSLTEASQPFNGFNAAQQQRIIDNLDQFS